MQIHSPMRIFFCCLLTVPASLPAQHKNLVVNPGFEIPADSVNAFAPQSDIRKAFGWDNPNAG